MLGSNVPTVGGLVNGFNHADDWGCECIQVYLTPSRTWTVPELQDSVILAFKEAWKRSRVKEVVAHIPFLVNIASSNSAIRIRAVTRLTKEIIIAQKLGVKYLILHPGSAGICSRSEALKCVVDGLDSALADFNGSAPRVLLETMAGQGTMTGSRFEEIAEIMRIVKKPELLGVCFDTAHVYFAGYDIRGYNGYTSVMTEFDKVVGLKRIRTFHVNDAKSHLGSGYDRHANIGEGRLGLQVFHALVRDERFVDIPKILEIPNRDEKSKENLFLLKNLRTRSEQLPATRENDREPRQLCFAGILR